MIIRYKKGQDGKFSRVPEGEDYTHILMGRDEFEQIENELEETKEKVTELENKNENFWRIEREKANSERGIPGKKHHSGYLVLDSKQIDQRSQEYNGSGSTTKYVRSWLSILQTPYISSVPAELVCQKVKEDLAIEKEDKTPVLLEIGITNFDKNAFEGGEYRLFVEGEKLLNGLYKAEFENNCREGFWKVKLYHTLSIYIPPEMLPKSKDK